MMELRLPGPASFVAPASVVRGGSLDTTDAMAGYDDDDDWVGTPPEGHYTRDRAKPEFWWRQRPPLSVTAVGIAIVVVVLVLVALLR
jgi:hypothetical protein